MLRAAVARPPLLAHPRRLQPSRPAAPRPALLPLAPRRRRRPAPIATSAALSPALPHTLRVATGAATHLVVCAVRAVILVAAGGAAATVAALVATGAWASTTASHPALWAVLAALLGARLASRAARADARRLRSAMADHSETLAGIERGVAVSEKKNRKTRHWGGRARARARAPMHGRARAPWAGGGRPSTARRRPGTGSHACGLPLRAPTDPGGGRGRPVSGPPHTHTQKESGPPPPAAGQKT